MTLMSLLKDEDDGRERPIAPASALCHSVLTLAGNRSPANRNQTRHFPASSLRGIGPHCSSTSDDNGGSVRSEPRCVRAAAPPGTGSVIGSFARHPVWERGSDKNHYRKTEVPESGRKGNDDGGPRNQRLLIDGEGVITLRSGSAAEP